MGFFVFQSDCGLVGYLYFHRACTTLCGGEHSTRQRWLQCVSIMNARITLCGGEQGRTQDARTTLCGGEHGGTQDARTTLCGGEHAVSTSLCAVWLTSNLQSFTSSVTCLCNGGRCGAQGVLGERRRGPCRGVRLLLACESCVHVLVWRRHARFIDDVVLFLAEGGTGVRTLKQFMVRQCGGSRRACTTLRALQGS